MCVRYDAEDGNGSTNQTAVANRLATHDPAEGDDAESLAVSNNSAGYRSCTGYDCELRKVD